MPLRRLLKRISLVKVAVITLRTFVIKPGLLTRVRQLAWYFSTYRAYLRLPHNHRVPAATENLYPRLYDNTGSHTLDPIYFYQNAWTAKKLFDARPTKHWDVGSHHSLTSIVAQHTPVTMVDIRPLPFPLTGLSFQQGDITSLPFEDDSIPSLSSICVIEHIGLGRYGDTLDPYGSEKAAAELVRVLAPGGDLYVTVPVDTTDRVYFNAHRAFTPAYVRDLFPLTLIEEVYLYGDTMQSSYDAAKGFGTGMYHFRKDA